MYKDMVHFLFISQACAVVLCTLDGFKPGLYITTTLLCFFFMGLHLLIKDVRLRLTLTFPFIKNVRERTENKADK